jgi:RNA polymerase sigma-70 factor, ECF subfamily
MIDQTLSLFEEHRQLLFGIAYRMLGSVSDAQDMVQETYLRWQQAAGESIRSPRAWLTTVVTRLCINHLQLARVKRETYVGSWLPEPLVDEQAGSPADTSILADSLSLAFLVLLETLSPMERAVFILREGFDCEFADIARIVEKSEANCRQILTRARKRIDERRPRYDVSRTDAEKLVAPFIEAVKNGDLETLLASMSDNVVFVSDGGGKTGAPLQPIKGPEPIARVLINVMRKLGAATGELRPATVNGLPGFVRFQDGQARGVLAFGIAGGRIQALFAIFNPDKLRHLNRPGPDSPTKPAGFTGGVPQV